MLAHTQKTISQFFTRSHFVTKKNFFSHFVDWRGIFPTFFSLRCHFDSCINCCMYYYSVLKKEKKIFSCIHVINLSSHHLTPPSFWKWCLILFFARYTFYSFHSLSHRRLFLASIFSACWARAMLMYEANYRWIKSWINPCNFLHSGSTAPAVLWWLIIFSRSLTLQHHLCHPSECSRSNEWVASSY